MSRGTWVIPVDREGRRRIVQVDRSLLSTSTTADVYTHTSADADRSAGARFRRGDLWRSLPSFGTWNKNAAVN